MANKLCTHCGCILRKQHPAVVIINYEVILPDDSGDQKVWVCPNPDCRRSNF